ncbi:SGNH/GDSL hydrolase family protein [Sphingomonas sp. AX6]|uniref:SGNH/GDSL hydrolase family protein n=1 Tax=Sphingomonas sp. AX6 TaxID=2653171 RepID=UPI0012F14D22|nr:SGNH/GDSL hydrolase family protein [Sphingomonas sp. AX6]VXC61968.1 Esterase [Sphingomonas sp. AX6]
MIRSLIALALLSVATPSVAQSWSRSWAVAPQSAPTDANRRIPDLTDRTVRQVVRLSSGGTRLRVRLSNEMSDRVLRIGSVEVALADADGRIVAGTSRQVRFDGETSAVVPMHAPLVSDPIALSVEPLARIAITIHLPSGAPSPTVHSHAAATAWIAPGNQTDAITMRNATRFGQRLMIAGVDVEARARQRTIVAFGDSITDGARATNDADTRWPDALANRLQAARMTGVGVANLGIGGNRVLLDGSGLNALARFDRDVLSVPGVSHVIILEGVNDIGSAWRDKVAERPTADDIIDGYRQIIARANDRSVKVVFGTILPYKGASYWSEWGEGVRAEVNQWIRTNREADGFVDFDAATRDPADPQRMAKAYDGGDALHPNDAGFKAMADAVALKLLR